MRILILSVSGRRLIIVDWQPARLERVDNPPCGDIRTFFSRIATGITKAIVAA
jgi:thymidylate synthase